MPANALVRFFSPDPRHEGVRPVQAWGLRLFFLLMLVFVAPTAWRGLLLHEGPWDPVRAVAVAAWATYPALALFGLLRPLRWLPLMYFTIGYKSIWLAFVAWPLWQAGTLWGTAHQDGSIRLNWRLVHFRLPVIDYVVAHELSHLRVMDHSPRFWDTVRSVVPDYAQLRGQLKDEALPPW